MSRVIDALEHFDIQSPKRIALEGVDASLNYGQLSRAVAVLAARLRNSRGVAIVTDNGPASAVADLACLAIDIPCVPVPLFFSPSQIHHLLTITGVDTLLTDRSVFSLLDSLKIAYVPRAEWLHQETGLGLHVIDLVDAEPRIPAGVAKVTFTSGTTGEPKGVCLSHNAMDQVAISLAQVSGAGGFDRHLSLLPHATLLENVGGLYASMLAGATCCLPGLDTVGMRGASGIDLPSFASLFERQQATTCILIPQMLLALVSAITQGMMPRPEKLRFIAVGGAPVSASLLNQAMELGLPVYEGYGLSEASSVIAVNHPEATKPGSVGKPLPHVQLRFAEDGEIEVAGSLFSGYLNDSDSEVREFWPTGDTGFLDDKGFLHLTGRKKHIFITAFGRNVAPEWVERELTVTKGIAQAVVFGEAHPFNVAVLAPRTNTNAKEMEASVNEANTRLPDYARIKRWITADRPFSVENGQCTGTGRPRREAIHKAYAERIEAIYMEEYVDGIL